MIIHNKKNNIVAMLAVLAFAWGAAAIEDDSLDSNDIAQLREGADAGDADAQYNLGTAYQKGDGVHQDDAIAARWFSRSANQNDPDGQFALGFAYRGGFGVQKDLVLSYMWFDLSGRHGNEEAFDMRSAVAEQMTYDQILEGRRLSRSWKPGTVPEK